MNKKQRVLLEVVYRLPADGRTAMYDFYGLLALWQQTGGTAKQYSGQGSIAPDRRHGVVEDVLASCAYQLAKLLGVLAARAVREELRHVTDEELIPPEDYAKWAEGTGDQKLIGMYSKSANRVVLPKHPYQDLGADRIGLIFAADFWREYADLYGGANWAKVLRIGMQLTKAAKEGLELDKLVDLIDKFYDLEHNTGSVASKLSNFSVEKVDLDIRARITGTRTFLKFVSPTVYKLLVSGDAYMTDKIASLVVAKIPLHKRFTYWKQIHDANENTLLVPKMGDFKPLLWPMHGYFIGKRVENGVEIGNEVYPGQFFELEYVESRGTRGVLNLLKE